MKFLLATACLFAVVLCAALLWAALRGASESAATDSIVEEPSEFHEHVAYVRDYIYWRLYITNSDPGDYASWEQGRGFDRLIELITSTVEPESWDKNGGASAPQYRETVTVHASSPDR